MSKKVLIIHTSVGLGHKFIAENIGYYLSQAGYEVRLADVYQTQSGGLINFFKPIYDSFLTTFPFIWNFLYSADWLTNRLAVFRLKVAGKNYLQTKKVIDEFKPDLIITTQTSASSVIAFLKQNKLYTGKFGIAFSDFHLHNFWLYEQADFYLANTKEQKQQMVDQKISADKIFVCGITLKPQVAVDTSSVKQKLGLKPEEKVVLVGTGSLGVGFKQKDLEELAKLENTKMIFACGKNQELYKKISSLKYSNVIPLGFYTPMDELYSIANIFVGKPGGLSTAESLRWNLPLLVTYIFPGQEEKNLKFLGDRNLVIPRPQNLSAAIKEELETGKFRKELENNPEKARLLGNGEAVVGAVNRMLFTAV